jgi:hypothetical protein
MIISRREHLHKKERYSGEFHGGRGWYHEHGGFTAVKTAILSPDSWPRHVFTVTSTGSGWTRSMSIQMVWCLGDFHLHWHNNFLIWHTKKGHHHTPTQVEQQRSQRERKR